MASMRYGLLLKLKRNKATSIAYEILFSQLINAKIIDLQTRSLKYKLQTDMILYIETWVNG